jgi:hypothetical protein
MLSLLPASNFLALFTLLPLRLNLYIPMKRLTVLNYTVIQPRRTIATAMRTSDTAFITVFV